jgi:CDP-4-dehydro-6-deoxyglucose reductase, E3
MSGGLLSSAVAEPGGARRGVRGRRSRAEVTVRPSGRSFVVEGRESLLEAGLRGGLKLNYGCGDGSCGLCKARVVSGATLPLAREPDRPLSAVEREQGYELLCTHTAASGDLTVQALEAEGPQDIPLQRISCAVRAVTALAADTLLLHLALPDSHRLRFLAGQSVTLAIGGAGLGVKASYPVANCPCDDRNLHFYVARDARDPFAEQLFAGGVRSGDQVLVAGPHGDFVLGDGRGQLVFAACDVGIAPIRSLIEHALAIDDAESLSLYWLATRPGGHFLDRQCRAWDEALDHFDYSLHRDVDPRIGALQVVEAIRVDRFPMQCDVYLAGPRAFVTTAADELRGAGLPAAQLHTTLTP